MELHQAISAFVAAPLRLQQFALIEAQPALLSPAAQTMLDGQRAQALAGWDLHRTQCLSACQSLLAACAQFGPRQAFFGGDSSAAPHHAAVPQQLQPGLELLARGERRADLLEDLARQTDPAVNPLLWQELRRLWAAALIEQKQAGPAVALCQDTLRQIHHALAPAEWAATQHVLGRALLQQRPCGPDAIEQAIAACQAALTVRQQRLWPVDWAQTSTNLALAHLARPLGTRTANINAAISIFQAVLGVKTRVRFPLDWAMIMNALGSAWIQQQDTDPAAAVERAIASFQHALEIRRRDRLPREWAQTLSNLANAFRLRRRGNPADNTRAAISAFEQLLDARTAADTPVEWARTMLNLALAWLDDPRGDREENIARAISACQQALRVFDPDAFPRERAQVLHNLAVAYLRQRRGDAADNIERALEACQQALGARRRETAPLDWALTTGNLALAYVHRQRGDKAAAIDAAIAANERALDVFSQENQVLDEARTRNNLGLALLERQRGSRAGDVERAIAAFQQALAVHTPGSLPLERAATLLNLARACRQRPGGDPAANQAQARQALEDALALLPAEAAPLARLPVLTELAGLLLATAPPADALPVFALVRETDGLLAQMEVTQDSAWRRIEDTAQLYAAAAYVHLQLGQCREAVVWLEQGKTRLLRDRLARDRELLHCRLAAADRDEYRLIEDDLRALEAEQTGGSPARRPFLEVAAQARTVRSRLRALVERIREDQPDFLGQGLDFDGIRHCLAVDGSAAVVAFTVTAHGAAAALLGGTPAAPEARRALLPDFTAQRLGELVQAWQRAAGSLHRRINAAAAVRTADAARGQTLYDQAVAGWDRAVQPLLQALDQELFQPVEEELARLAPRELVLIPHGGLHVLPLHLAGAPRHLLDRYDVRYAPSFALLRPGQPPAPIPQRLLGVGDPLGDLPGSRAELAEAAAHFPDSTLLAGAAATAAAVMAHAPGHDVLHLACHGELDLADPYASKLLLAPAGEGWNLARIMRDLRLPRSPLVVLTACESGLLAPEKLPDEYLTLAAGFLATGARTVLSTLWRIDDRSARLLINAFYQQWLGQGRPPAAALRQAQALLRRQPATASPHHWGAFVLSGAA